MNVSEDERVTHRLTGLHQLDLAEFFFRHYVLEHRTVGIVVYQTQLVGEGSDYERIVRLIGYRLELIPIGIGFVKDVVEPNACRLVRGQLASVGVEDGAVCVDEILGTDGILREWAQVVVLDVCVYTDALPSSANADLMLDTTFTDAAALKGYSTHPAHVAVADGKVRPYTAVRTCLDFNV